MKPILLSTAAVLGFASLAWAQEQAPEQDAAPAESAAAESTWFEDGQATVAARLAIQPNTNVAKNVILFTADGNGVGTNYAIRLFEGQSLGGLGDDHVQPHEAFPNTALVKTYSTNGQTPDSAPTAAAMNTGYKTKNDLINIPDSVAVDDCAAGLETNLQMFSEIATEMGKSVGVVSTARITHATPAAVYSRTVNRDWEDNTFIPEGCGQKDIAAQLFDALQAGTIDFAMGGGRKHFLPDDVTDSEGEAGARTDGRNIPEELKALGAQYVEGEEDFMALTLGGNAPILGLFEASHMQYEHDRTGEPSLAQMTEAAINTLSANDSGFYLSIEAGRVDHANHAGNLHRTLTDGVAFNDAIRKALELTNPEETLIIVTADHEHAITFNGYCGRGSAITGLCMEIDEAGVAHTGNVETAADGKTYTVAGFLNGAGSVLVEQPSGEFFGARRNLTEEQATDPDFLQEALIPMSSETHTGEDVMVFAQGPWAHLFGGTIEQNVIFHVMNHAVSPE